MTQATPPELTEEDFSVLDDILDDLRTRDTEVPQWEFCEGFMAALICCRRLILPSEYLPLLLGNGDDGQASDAAFADAGQFETFMNLWMRRWNEVAAALNADVESLEDDAAYHPEVMDIRGAVAALPPDERDAVPQDELPAFGQVWAVGFMFAVENWPQEWEAPRDKEAAQWLNDALEAIVAMTEDDTDAPTLSVFDDDGPPTLSVARLNAFGAAIWAVYDLRELWRTLGPRVAQARKTDEPGRNDLCYCGSGKKYKRCHGAN